ncbi:MAG TPA: GGDEF domain-containing phosphodiesterase [Gammaproteobacteria bacterium]
MSAAREEQPNGSRSGASIRFIERFLREGPRGKLTALLLGQLDAFNRIATTFGHERCEDFCAGYAEQLRDSLPPRTPIIRLSERRFAVLLALDSMSAVMDAAIALTEERPPHLTVGGDSFLVDVTLGIAVYPSHADEATSLFRRAELALKEARDNELPFDIYRPDTTQQQAALWKLETELGEAVEREELDVYFQPKVALASGAVAGLEALARWRTPSGRFVPATDFIPLAERTGSVVPITWLVFNRILERAAQWRCPADSLAVAVNISPQVLEHPEFLPRLKSLHTGLGALGIGLMLELTEESLVQSDRGSLACLEHVRKLGIELAIDDFGKGYSSLSYLKQIPAAEIKIDKRFVATIAVDDKDRHIVESVVTLAHAFGMRVVAEGVDNAEALRTIHALGCEMAQGFFIARPMRGDLIPEWIANYRLPVASTPSKVWVAPAAV